MLCHKSYIVRQILAHVDADNDGHHRTSDDKSDIKLHRPPTFRLLALGERAIIEAMPSQAQRRRKQLTTFDDVVEALGGVGEVGRMLDQNSAAVCNWKRRRERFPTKYYKIMMRELDARGVSAPDSLWGFVE